MEAKKLRLDSDVVGETKPESDFTVKVGVESFPVHRNILMTASDYFRAMLTHDTKERQEGVVDMMGVEPDGVKLCIEFMYTGTTTVTMETVENILPAAEIMLLKTLSEICIEILEKNLKAENCITILRLATRYSFSVMEEKALQLFRENFKYEGFGEISSLTKEDVVRQITNCELNNDLGWELIINWIILDVEKRSKNVFELVQTLDWEIFPSAELLKKLSSEPLFVDHRACKKLLFRCLFMDSVELKRNINVKNCFVLKRLSDEFEFLSKNAKNVIHDFMKINLIQLSKEREFKSLNEEIITSIFESRTVECLCDESARWQAILTWVKADVDRSKSFPKLLQTIQFDDLSKEFISTTLKNEQLFLESFECHKILLDALTKIEGHARNRCHAAFLYPDRRIFILDLLDKTWRELPVFFKNTTFQYMFSMHDRLCIIHGEKLFYLTFNNKSINWVPRSSLDHVPGRDAKVSVVGNFIFVIEKERVSFFDSTTNKWSSHFPGCDFNKFIVSSQGPGVFVHSTTNECCFLQVPGNQWPVWRRKVRSNLISADSSATFHRGKLYIAGVEKDEPTATSSHQPKPDYFHVVCVQNKTWKTLNDLPTSVTSKTWLFSTGNDLLLYVSGKLYMYHDLCDSWVPFCKIPQCARGGIGATQHMDPISVCSFVTFLQ